MDQGRIWAVTNELITDDEAGRCYTAVGWLVSSEMRPIKVREALEGDGRDVIILAPTRVLVVEVKPSKKLGLMAAVKMARGNLSGVATVKEYARADITGLEYPAEAPTVGALVLGGLGSVKLTYRIATTEFTRFLIVDESFENGDLTSNFKSYMSGTVL